MATEPLGEDRARALMPSDVCVEDVRYILDYSRMSADKQLFGGGTVYGGADPSDIKAKLWGNMPEGLSAASRRAHRPCLVGELRPVLHPRAADGPDRDEYLFRAWLFGAWRHR